MGQGQGLAKDIMKNCNRLLRKVLMTFWSVAGQVGGSASLDGEGEYNDCSAAHCGKISVNPKKSECDNRGRLAGFNTYIHWNCTLQSSFPDSSLKC